MKRNSPQTKGIPAPVRASYRTTAGISDASAAKHREAINAQIVRTHCDAFFRSRNMSTHASQVLGYGV